MANSLQEALEELTGVGLDDLFHGMSTGVDSGGSSTEASDGGSTSGDGDDGSTGGSASEPVPVPDDLAGMLAELARLQGASAAALSKDPADWTEFGRLQARMQDLVDALTRQAESS
jgi:hypothetical protein